LNWNPTVFEVLASGGFDNKVHIWNILSPQPLYSINISEQVMSLEWSPTGSLIAATTKDKLVHLLDPRANKEEYVYIFLNYFRILKDMNLLKILKHVGLIVIT
jgi:WD40 repeat protein